jgi:hypothetical protein
MKVRFTTAVLLIAVVLALLSATAAFAGGGTGDIIDDAANGTVDGNYSAGQVQAALAYLKNNPTYSQYSDAQGVLEDYLASLSGGGSSGGSADAPGVLASGELAFTGGEIWVFIAAGSVLAGLGLALKRRVRA